MPTARRRRFNLPRLIVFGLLAVALVNATGIFAPSGANAAGGTLGPLSFSLTVDANRQPINPATNFTKPAQVVISFDYKDVPPGTRLSRIIRFEGADIIFGDLPALPGTSGRYATAVSAGGVNTLAEGNWEAVFFLDGTQAAIGTFGVYSAPGSDTSGGTDSGNGNGNSNGNNNGNGNSNSNGNNNGNSNGNDNS